MMAYDGEESTGKKRKRAKASSNPLSHARGKWGSKVAQLWHRKSGAGFSLFVAYYGGQPKGTVVADVAGKQPVSSKNEGKKPIVGAGMSRAAKRRKKKKNKDCNVETVHDVETESFQKEMKHPQTVGDADFVATSRLLQVLDTPDGIQYAHLRSYLESLSKPLPLSFRIREGISSSDEAQLTESLSEHLELVEKVKFGDGRIYQAKASSHLTKVSLSKLAPSLKALLVERSSDGTLARQEVASMLPAIALKHGGWLKRKSRVLDVCASPGSKTLQALEIVSHKGRVRANDVSPDRLAGLKDAVERSGMPPELRNRVSYSNYDATKFPLSQKLFDTVICDVPCSGDGTIRKDKHILPMWTPATANALHGLQVRILVRAIKLLKVGGVMSYSTCSLNPVEDEAVVAAAVIKARTLFSEAAASDGQPAVEIVDFPHLEGFTRRQGICSWRVADYTAETDDNADEELASVRWHETFQDAVDANMEHVMKSMWPPKDVDDLHLERCTRLWPQDHDTGGFFVALIRKNR